MEPTTNEKDLEILRLKENQLKLEERLNSLTAQLKVQQDELALTKSIKEKELQLLRNSAQEHKPYNPINSIIGGLK